MKKTFRSAALSTIIMLVVAILTLTSVTYAWFAANTSVSATDMKVQVVAGNGLAIGAYTGTSAAPVAPDVTAFKSTVKAIVDTSNTNLNPTSTANCQAWYTTVSDSSDNYAKGASATYESAPAATAYLLSKYQMKSLNDSTPVYVNGVTVTGNDKSGALNQSLRVAVKMGSKILTFAPFYTAIPEGGLKYYNGSAVATYADGAIKVGTSYTADSSVQLTSSLGTTATDVDVYVYYEGEDTNCFTNNTFSGIDELTVSVSFTSSAAS